MLMMIASDAQLITERNSNDRTGFNISFETFKTELQTSATERTAVQWWKVSTGTLTEAQDIRLVLWYFYST